MTRGIGCFQKRETEEQIKNWLIFSSCGFLSKKKNQSKLKEYNNYKQSHLVSESIVVWSKDQESWAQLGQKEPRDTMLGKAYFFFFHLFPGVLSALIMPPS